MNYKIKPVFLGSMRGDKADCLLDYPKGEMITTVYACFIVEGNGRTILVDSGLPSQEDIIRNKKPFRIMEDAPDFLTALGYAGVQAEDVTDVILTHLHYDHCCNLRYLVNVKDIYVQKRELLHAVSPLPGEYRYYSLKEGCGTPEWIDGFGKFRILDGDGEVMPGIRVLLTPGHSPGSQSVRIDTAKGPYLLTGDYIGIMDSYIKKIPNIILNNKEEWFESYEKVKSAGAELLPGHDSCIFSSKQYG